VNDPETIEAREEIPQFEQSPDGSWLMHYRGRSFVGLRCKGHWFLRELMLKPFRKLDALEVNDARDGRAVRGNAGDQVDERTVHSIRDRLRQIEALDTDAARDEEAMLMAYLARGLVFSHRARPRPRIAGSDLANAYQRVRKQIDRAIEEIENCHPELGRRLRASIDNRSELFFDPNRFRSA
jgi:hypothetical protein